MSEHTRRLPGAPAATDDQRRSRGSVGRPLLVLALVAASTVALTASFAGAAVSGPTDLGTFGGSQSQALGISGSAVYGVATLANGIQHGFVEDLSDSPPMMRDLGPFFPEGVSGHVVVGESTAAGDPAHAFAYDWTLASPRPTSTATPSPTSTASPSAAPSGPPTSPPTSSPSSSPSGPGPQPSPTGPGTGTGSPSTPPGPPAPEPPNAGMVDLGTLGGTSSAAAAISGTTAVGTSSVAGDTATHAVAWDLSIQPAAIRDLGTLGGASSTAIGVSGGVVIGTSWISGNTEQHAFAYDLTAASPSMLDLGTLGGIMSSPTGVSGSRVVGYSTNGASIPHAFVYDISAASPAMVDLGSSPGDPSAAIAVSGTVATGYQNDAGGTQHAVAWDLGVTPPTLRDLGSVGAGDSTGRAVSGSIVVGNSAGHAFAYDLAAGSPAMVDLGTLGGANSFATGVSSSIVVGRADLSSGAQHAVVWDLSAQPLADANADGVADALQPAGTAAGAFVDGSLSPNTVGSIVNTGGILVTVADAVSASDGVQISVGTGSGSATFAVCGGFNLSISAGSTVVITCGSVRVNTLSGSASVLLGNGTTVTIAAGAVGKVSSNAGTFSVSNLGTTPGVTVTTNGVVLPVPPGTATAVDQTPPAIVVAGATSYTVDQTVTLTCSASDASGIKATNCPRLVSAPAQSFPLGATTVTATATDNAGNSATRAVTFTVRVTPVSLCQLTKQMLQSSSRYLSLKPAQRPAADARAILACQPVLAISPTTPAKSKAALVSAYKVAVRALLGDWLTPAQIQKLTTYADAL